ncbi:sulfatase-like hydrolase/transferase [Niabella ginsengisoli]|uniref:Sulfatase-like hydrolase/transferase n=1 Tax=Niabella ginsengisoli TaxID=522298 RepID=A0ABS9SR77_9BACT|nr:sulfatase-like hydrolase/transferase [Niabella ginsengisoli]
MPFNAPQKYWDMYKEDGLSLSPSPFIPQAVNKASLHESGELNGYKLSDERASLNKPVSNAYARKLRHAYYASISYTDAQIGKVLEALKETGMDKNTIVVLWGDHGWHLGDDLVWGKHTLFDWALRSAFIVKTPQMKQGEVCNNIVSSVDVYPTLMQLCGLNMPYAADGQSLVPLLKNKKQPSLRDAALSYYNQGITIRTPHYRFTKYFRKGEPTIELYNHKNDPYEQKNVAAQNPEIVKKMMTSWKTEIDKAQKMYANAE